MVACGFQEQFSFVVYTLLLGSVGSPLLIIIWNHISAMLFASAATPEQAI